MATSPLSSATAPQCGKAGEAAWAVASVAETGEAGVVAGASARHSRWMPAAGPLTASRATVSRSALEPGSPSTITTVYGPWWRAAVAATASGAAVGQPGPNGPSSRRRTSSAVRASACSRS
ncbi:hypothetical protein GCM10020000_49990 [Streptomyces olivoverticillatus]